MKFTQPCSLAVFVCFLTVAWIAPGPLHLSGFLCTPIFMGVKVRAAQPPTGHKVRAGFDGTQVIRDAQKSSLDRMLSAHMAWQAAALKRLTDGSKHSSFPGVILVTSSGGGWGNRLPGYVTGLLMAVLSRRVFLLQPHDDVLDYLDFNWDVDWRKYSAHLDSATTCTIDYNLFLRPDLAWCSETSGTADVLQYNTLDYDVPLLEVNPAFAKKIAQLFPDGNIFHQVATRLFGPSRMVVDAAKPYQDLSRQCLVGMHIRGHKPVPGVTLRPLDLAQQFVDVTKSVAMSHAGTIFVAADMKVFSHIRQSLPSRLVWWTNLTRSTVDQQQAAGSNPGSNLSAFVDMFLLAQCKHIILTAGSSFGTMASGYSSVAPIYVIQGDHTNPFFNPYFWKGLSSEPQFYKYAVRERHQLDPSVLQAIEGKHIRAMEIEQLHP